jgi:hypothetical protein
LVVIYIVQCTRMIIFAFNLPCAVHRSGSGKTCNLKRALSYLVKTTVDPEQPVPSSFSGKYAFNRTATWDFSVLRNTIVCFYYRGEDVGCGLPAGEFLQYEDQSEHPRHPPGTAAPATL